MTRTNINIIHEDHKYNYLIEYIQDSLHIDMNNIEYIKNDYLNRLDIVSTSDYIYHENNWYNKDSWRDFIDGDYDSEYLPENYDKSIIRVNFPEFSPEIYDKNIYYMLNINTWINGKYIYLGSKLFNRFNSLANEEMIRFDSNKYFEYVEFDIIDPFDIQYGDNWKNFRINVCGERENGEGETINNTGAQLCFSLYIIEESGENEWIKNNSYTGGQNSINITTNDSDYLTLNQSIEFNPSDGLVIRQKLNFNKIYDGDLYNYLKETYLIDVHSLKYALVVKDDNRIYYGLNEDGEENVTKTEFKITEKFTKADISFNGWQDWQLWENTWNTNVSFASSVTFYDEDGRKLLYIISNEIPLTKEIYKYLVNDIDNEEYKYIDLNDLDMEVKNFNVVNKIVNQIVQFDKPEDSKSNIIQPVFFRTRELQDLIIHPKVTENICINLDSYKSKVEVFSIQIEDCNFKQIGSNAYGIIFKIIGKNLANKKPAGVYYILNENNELVTTGKYTYEQ